MSIIISLFVGLLLVGGVILGTVVRRPHEPTVAPSTSNSVATNNTLVGVKTQTSSTVKIPPQQISSTGKQPPAQMQVNNSKKTDEQVAAAAHSQVFVNQTELTSAQMQSFAKKYGETPKPGNYWYDARSGAYGNIGGPTLGLMYPGENFGVLARNASNGSTGILVNGRELPLSEAVSLGQLVGSIPAGAYWLYANGDYGIAGNSEALGNLLAAARARGESRGRGGDNFWSSGVYSVGNSNADNSQGYVSVPGYGPVGYGF